MDSMAITVTVRREPHRATIAPASGSAATEPAAMASSSRPRADGSSSRCCLTWGMRDAQLAKPKPDAANTR